jgi:predicted N-acetyltransferase YhbS
MSTPMPEPPGATAAIDALLDRAFGPQRRRKTAERLREDSRPAADLSFVVIDEAGLMATLRFWPVRIGDRVDALLLGPAAVAPGRQGQGLGSRLIWHGLRAARRLGHGAVILVGDEPYYGRFGFAQAPTRRMVLPGPVDRRRFLGLELVDGALADAMGLVRAAPEAAAKVAIGQEWLSTMFASPALAAAC